MLLSNYPYKENFYLKRDPDYYYKQGSICILNFYFAMSVLFVVVTLDMP